jgi:hypothetical protein
MKHLCIVLAIVLTIAALSILFPVPAAADDPCATAKSTVTVDRLAIENGVIKAGGKWEASGGASGVLIEVRIEADAWQSESFTATSGTWDFAQAFKWSKCGHFGLRVYAYPAVTVNGHLYNCLERASSAPWRFDVPCGATAEITHCEWECEGEGDASAGTRKCAGVCTGSASSGTPPYRAFWGLNDRDYKPAQELSAGSWTEVVHCAGGDKVSFKVKDLNGNGRSSPVVQLACGAEPGEP